MISVVAECDAQGNIKAFTAKNHGASHVCAAASLLIQNTINSIAQLTDAPHACEYKQDGGYIWFELAEPAQANAKLLMDAMMLGLKSVQDKYPSEIETTEKE
jgi:hypothetical protein